MTIELTILHTNDMHGRVQAMARLSAFAKQIKAEAETEGRTVFFWDAGDSADRRFALTTATKGAAMADVLNAMGYSLQTIGNDIPLTYGPHAIPDIAARARFPILGANMRNGNEPLWAGLREIEILPLANGIQLGVLGLTAHFDGIYQVFGLRFPDAYETARALVAQLQAVGCRTIVALSHLGLPEDREMAERVPGIDVIIGGHTHDLLAHGEIVANVLLGTAGQFAEHLGRIDLTLDEAGRVIERSAQVLDVPSSQTPDPLVLDAIAKGEREAETLLAEPVGELRAALDLNYFDECGIGDLAADAIREHMRGEIAMVASGCFHAGLPSGTITRDTLYKACFTTANPMATLMTGAQVRAALERGLEPAVNTFEHHSFRGTPVGIPQISGMIVEYNPAAPDGSRIQRITLGGIPIEPERLYRVAHTDAESSDYTYFEIADGQPSESEVPIILPEVIEAYLVRHTPPDAPTMGRWVKH